MDLGLRGRVAVVTGASQGIGREIALQLAAEGADLVLCARRQDALDAVAEQGQARGVNALVVAGDVTDSATATQVMSAATRRFGRVDVLVNNAGKGTALLSTRCPGRTGKTRSSSTSSASCVSRRRACR